MKSIATASDNQKTTQRTAQHSPHFFKLKYYSFNFNFLCAFVTQKCSGVGVGNEVILHLVVKC